MNFNVKLSLVLSVMPVSGLASFITIMLVLVKRKWIGIFWNLRS